MLKLTRLTAALSTAAILGIVCLIPSTSWARGGGGHGGSHGGSVYVHGYYRSNGTYVSPYIRSAPNSGYGVELETGTSYGGSSDTNIPDLTKDSSYSNDVEKTQLSTVDNFIKLGNEAAQNREYKQALTWFQFALHEQPNNPDVIKAVNLMQSYVQTEEVAPAAFAASSTVVEDTKIVDKPLPKLRTMDEQLDYKAKDAEAVIKSTLDPSTSEMLAVLAGNPPVGTDVCRLPYSAITLAIYQQCIHEGMNYVQVSNIIGWAGEETANSGSTLEYTWREGDKGIMRAVFQDNRLISKSQVGLK